MKVNKISRIALFTAVLCLISPFTIPFGAIPFSLSALGIYLTALFLPDFYSVWTVLTYVLLGLFGMPVFSGFQGGVGVIAGPTGGFIVGYIICAFIIALLKKKNKLLSLILGTAALYVSGLLWYSFVTETGIFHSFLMSAMPFIPFDSVKIFVAYILSEKIPNSK